MSSNPTHLLSNKNNLGSHMPFCNPPKNPIFITTVSTSVLSLSLSLSLLPSKEIPVFIFHPSLSFSTQPNYVGFIGFLVLVRVSQRKQGRREPFHFLLPLSLFLVSLPLYCFVLLPSVSLSPSLFQSHPYLGPLFSSLFATFRCLCS